MDEGGERLRDLRQRLHQLDMEARGSALTPGEAAKNQDQRKAVLEELAELEGPPAAPDAGGR